MANLSESAVWEAGIYRIELTDAVIGGEDGIDNKAAKQLANRTTYLKQEVDSLLASVTSMLSDLTTAQTDITNIKNTGLLTNGLHSYDKGVIKVTSGTTVNITQVGAIYAIQPSSGSLSVVLPNPASCAAGAAIAAVIVEPSDPSLLNAVVGFSPSTGNLLGDGSLFAVGDSVEFIASPSTSEWFVKIGRKKFDNIPTGMIIDFPLSSPPPGFIVAMGQDVSRTTYKYLFATIGVTYGVGNGTTTFTLPDYRGVFRRGLDLGRGLDASRAIGTYQADDLASHTHTYHKANGAAPQSGSTTPCLTGDDVFNTGATGGTETRPKNTSVLTCIKYK